MTEDELLDLVVKECGRLGYLVYHTKDSRSVNKLGKGFPDLVIVTKNDVLFVELKDDWQPLKPEQTTWRYSLMSVDAHHEVWRPADWRDGYIQRVLSHL